MPEYRITFNVPSEVSAVVTADDAITDHLNSVSVPTVRGVQIHASIDGMAADSIEEV